MSVLNEQKLIYFLSFKWFQVSFSNTNSSINYESFFHTVNWLYMIVSK